MAAFQGLFAEERRELDLLIIDTFRGYWHSGDLDGFVDPPIRSEELLWAKSSQALIIARFLQVHQEDLEAIHPAAATRAKKLIRLINLFGLYFDTQGVL